jgi:disulfide bond formation protein DsbB
MLDFKTMRLFFSLLALAANAAVAAGLLLAVGARVSGSLARLQQALLASLAGWELRLAFLVATVATLGSLYYSKIVNLVPCEYCWYQRIAMYPLVVILGMAIWKRDRTVAASVAPLAVIGTLLAGYHYFLQLYPRFGSGQCSATAPCNSAFFKQFGFISIPYQALSAFALILLLMAALRATSRGDTPS